MGSDGMGAPFGHRLLLRLYPRAFRDEFEGDLVKHLGRQRVEERYGRPLLGAARFWWEAGTDAVKAGITLRFEGARERLVRLWRGEPRGGAPDGLGTQSAQAYVSAPCVRKRPA